jgi:hypothetical protein
VSGLANSIFTKVLAAGNVAGFNSYRLIDNEIGSYLAAYCGTGVYLDAALMRSLGYLGFSCPIMSREISQWDRL